jgi:DNA modification methylase
MTSRETATQNHQIQTWPIERLVFYARNPRRNDAVVDRMCSSIREFGFKIPVLARSDGEVVDGHLRLKAARKLGSWPGGDTTAIPVILCDEWSPAQVKAFRLMVNRSVAWAEWDTELLSLELQELNDAEFDLSLTGFDEEELTRLLAEQEPPATDEDEVPEAPETPVTIPGDLWLLASRKGRPPHRVLCGDATDRAATVRLLAGQKPPFIMATDPPYGVDLEPEWREEVGLNPRTRQGGKVSNDDRVDWSAAYALFPGDVAYVWHAGVHASEVAVGLYSCEFQIRAQIIWKKQHFAISRGAYHWGHEPCWYAVRKAKTSHWRGDRTQSTVWEVANLNPFGGNSDAENEVTGHGTQKPVELMRRPILNHTQPGEAVYDPFLGSGSSLIAAESTGRVCYGIDIDPKYVDVAVLRWQRFSGQKATLDGDGRTFEEMAEERRKEAA